MRILLVHQYYLENDDAGISRFNQFVKYWTARGHTVTVLCGMVHYMTGIKPEKYRGKLLFKELIGERCEIVRVFVSDSYNKNFMGRMWGYFSFTLSSLVALLTLKKHDLVIATSPPLFAGIPGLLAGFFWRAPFVFEVRDLWPESAIDLGVLTNPLLIKLSYAVEKILYGSARMINVLTPAFRDALMAKGVPADKIIMVPNGADTDLLTDARTSIELRKSLGLENKCIFLYIGAHGLANNLDQLLSTAELLRDNPSLVFLFIGTGMKKPELVEKARMRKLNNVLFLDQIPKARIADYIYAADVGVAVLKKLDTFKTVYPNKVFDYMACGKPILLGIDGVARELVEKAQAGLYFEPENAQDCAQKVLSFFSDKEARLRMGASGKKYVTQHYSREALALEFEQHLLSLNKHAICKP